MSRGWRDRAVQLLPLFVSHTMHRGPKWPGGAEMGHATAGIGDWPVAAWVVVLGVLVFVCKYAVLRWRWAACQPAARQAERRLIQAASRLRDYATANLQRLPDRLEEAGGADDLIAYRPVPRLTLDGRLILLHDAAATRKVLEFPNLRDGRGVVFCNGRILVVTEDAFDKLLAADEALREKLGLGAMGTGSGAP